MGQKIVIVEDDPLISRMYQTVFTFEGFDVVMARDGEEGVTKIKEELPVMVLLDVMMPKMTGLDVLKEIKSYEATKSIPVVVLTNLSGMNDAEQAISLGAVKFIVKSDNKPKEIVQQIKEILAASTRDVVPEAASKK